MYCSKGNKIDLEDVTTTVNDSKQNKRRTEKYVRAKRKIVSKVAQWMCKSPARVLEKDRNGRDKKYRNKSNVREQY